MKQILYNQQVRDLSKFGMLLMWMAIIYYFSSLPGSNLPVHDYWELILRKIAHVTEYSVLMLLIFKVVSIDGRNSFQKNLLISMLLCFLVSVGDESHQGLTAGRHPRYLDLLIDLSGSIITSWLLVLEKIHQLKWPNIKHWIKL